MMQQLISRSRSCTNSSRMETCRTCLNLATRTEVPISKVHGTAWFTEYPAPRSCKTRGRRPHVPSSKSLCQRATKTDALSNPFFEGRPVRLAFGDRRSVPVRSTASVEWLLCPTSPPVNSHLKLSVFFSKHTPKTPEIRHSPSSAHPRTYPQTDQNIPESPPNHTESPKNRLQECESLDADSFRASAQIRCFRGFTAHKGEPAHSLRI